MPGLYGDLLNLARNPGLEIWNQGTNTTTSAAEGPDMWTLGVGTGSTLNVSRASTGQDTGTFCAGIAYTHVITSEIHQVANLGDMKLAATISFGLRVASATAACCRLFLSPDGGVTKTYGNFNSGAGATTYEQLKVEGFAVASTATAIWYGVEFVKTSAAIYLDTATLNVGSAVATLPTPQFGKAAAWTITSGATNRAVDMTGTATTLIAQAVGTLVKDLQAIGILP